MDGYADIYAVQIEGRNVWRWISADGRESSAEFEYYFDCLADAMAHGFKVVPGRIREA